MRVPYTPERPGLEKILAQISRSVQGGPRYVAAGNTRT